MTSDEIICDTDLMYRGTKKYLLALHIAERDPEPGPRQGSRKRLWRKWKETKKKIVFWMFERLFWVQKNWE